MRPATCDDAGFTCPGFAGLVLLQPFSGRLISSNTKVTGFKRAGLRLSLPPFHSQHNMAHHQYPEVEGGGSLILAWQVKNKKVLVIGGGEVRCSTSSNSTVQIAWRK